MAAGPREGVTAHLQDLVYDDLSEHYEVVANDGHVATFRRRSDSALSAPQLLGALEHPLLLSKKGDGETVIAEFSDATFLPNKALTGMVNTGPYEQVSVSDSRMVLRRRREGERGPSLIEVLKFDSQQEEWRRFLAREVDVVPFAWPSTVRHLSRVPSVRLVPVAEGSVLGMYFNIRSPRLNKPLRQAISLGLRRSALAEYAAGDRALAVEFAEDLAVARERIPANRQLKLRLFVLAGSTELARTALGVQHQLAVLGIDVTVRPFSLDDLPRILASGEYDLLVLYGDLSRRYLSYFASDSPANRIGYANPEFDQALARGDWDRCAEIARSDLPLTPLLRLPVSIAVDSRFCGIRPKTVHDLSWLADVHPCAPGEVE